MTCLSFTRTQRILVVFRRRKKKSREEASKKKGSTFGWWQYWQFSFFEEDRSKNKIDDLRQHSATKQKINYHITIQLLSVQRFLGTELSGFLMRSNCEEEVDRFPNKEEVISIQIGSVENRIENFLPLSSI